jgi:NADPH:quinone reductase-like Zn-dependent oxidoreductase
VRPVVDTEVPLTCAREAFTRLDAGTQFGKVVLTTS